MRIIMRCFGLSVIFIVIVMIFTQMMNFQIRRDELTTCISTAMSSTQIIMQEQIEDEVYGTNNKRKTIDSNQAYLEEFKNHFYKLVNSDSSFKIKVYGVDYTKGFLDLEIESSFKMLNGDIKTIKSRKTSIIDIII